MQSLRSSIIAAAIVIVCSNLIAGTALFNEDFETTLDQWAGDNFGPHNGAIVDDPIRQGNKVLSFTSLENGGDIFHADGITLIQGREYTIAFEYLGLEIFGSSVAGDLGGFFGISDVVGDPFVENTWLFATRDGYPGLRGALIDDSQWHTYSYTFNWHRSEIQANDDVVHIMIEDWIGSGGIAGDVY